MKPLLFDTNVLLLFLRGDAHWQTVYETYNVENTLNCLSVVSLGELYALALRNNWGERRIAQIAQVRRDFTIIDINIEDIIQKYAQIDAFSQGKLLNRPLNVSARNMGKNDLWIAATASVYDMQLLTADADFEHLDTSFLSLGKI
jgi:tRNA(fMet)-specific endonuclease VapC